MALHWYRTQGLDSSSSPALSFFPNAVTIYFKSLPLSPGSCLFSASLEVVPQNTS